MRMDFRTENLSRLLDTTPRGLSDVCVQPYGGEYDDEVDVRPEHAFVAVGRRSSDYSDTYVLAPTASRAEAFAALNRMADAAYGDDDPVLPLGVVDLAADPNTSMTQVSYAVVEGTATSLLMYK